MDKRYALIDEIFGHIIASKRKKRGLDQKKLSEKLGINQPALSRIERGESAVNITTLVKLAEALGTSPTDLIVQFETDVRQLKHESILVVPKKELPKDDSSLGKMLLVGGALALLVSSLNK